MCYGFDLLVLTRAEFNGNICRGRCGENITKWHFPRLKIILHFMEYSCTILRAFSNACTFGAIRTRSSARVGFPVLSDPMVQPVPESSSFFRRPSM